MLVAEYLRITLHTFRCVEYVGLVELIELY